MIINRNEVEVGPQRKFRWVHVSGYETYIVPLDESDRVLNSYDEDSELMISRAYGPVDPIRRPRSWPGGFYEAKRVRDRKVLKTITDRLLESEGINTADIKFGDLESRTEE